MILVQKHGRLRGRFLGTVTSITGSLVYVGQTDEGIVFGGPQLEFTFLLTPQEYHEMQQNHIRDQLRAMRVPGD